VKVLDFGLAKAIAGEGVSSDPGGSPAITAMATATGVILGTAAYMSPEQMKEKAVDRRADVWAFGCVLYEMLTGRRAFAADGVSETLAAVLTTDVDLETLPTEIPARLRQVLITCLRKDPKQRVRDIGDVRLAMEGAFESPLATAGATPAAGPAHTRFPLALTVGVVVAALAVGMVADRTWFRAPETVASGGLTFFTADVHPAERLTGGGSSPAGTYTQFGLEQAPFGLQRPSLSSFVLSPDGRLLVYVGVDGETTQLYRRALNQPDATPIPGTEGAFYPFFAPDSRTVGFHVFERGRGVDLKRATVDGSDVRTIAAAGEGLGLGLHWTDDDTIVVLGFPDGGLYEIPANGGSPLALAEAAAGERYLAPAMMLPGRRGVLFSAASTEVPSEWPIFVQPLDGGARQLVIEGGSDPRYLPSGHIVFARRGTLMAVPFNIDRLEVTGELPVGRFPAPSQRVDVDVRLDQVVLRTLEKEPRLRYQQASELSSEVESLSDSGWAPTQEEPPSVGGRRYKHEYRSRYTIWGIPLIHVASSGDSTGKQMALAKGVIAIGDMAVGLIAIGAFAFGGFTIGGAGVGVVSLGGISAGLLLAIGGIAFGGFAIGSVAFGVVANGVLPFAAIDVSSEMMQRLSFGAWALVTALVTAGATGLLLWWKDVGRHSG